MPQMFISMARKQYSSMNYNLSNRKYQTMVTYFKHFILRKPKVGWL